MHPAVLDERMERRRNYSALRKAPRIDLVSSIPLAGPLAVYVEPTNLCNFKCVFCPESFANFKEQSFRRRPHVCKGLAGFAGMAFI